jgi:hypothetical protein
MIVYFRYRTRSGLAAPPSSTCRMRSWPSMSTPPCSANWTSLEGPVFSRRASPNICCSIWDARVSAGSWSNGVLWSHIVALLYEITVVRKVGSFSCGFFRKSYSTPVACSNCCTPKGARVMGRLIEWTVSLFAFLCFDFCGFIFRFSGFLLVFAVFRGFLIFFNFIDAIF